MIRSLSLGRTHTCPSLKDSLLTDYRGTLGLFEELSKLPKKESLKEDILQEVVPISRETIYHLLKECTKTRDLTAGQHVQCLMLSTEFHSVAVLGDHLIRIFALCGSLLEASLVFCMVSRPTVYTWNAIISAHATLGESEMAIDLYDKMQEEGIRPDKVVFLCILKACSSIGALKQGKLVHNEIIRSGILVDAVIRSALIDMYAKSGSVEEARNVFDESSNVDVVTFGTMISAYAQHGQGFSALELFNKMQYEGIMPDRVTFLCVLKAISSIGAIQQGRMIHEKIIQSGCELDVVFGSTLVDVYAKCGSLEDAQRVFDALPDRNVVTWNAIIAAYVQHGHGRPALEFCMKMQQNGIKPAKVTFLCTLKACGSIGSTPQGRLLHDQVIRNGHECDDVLCNSLIDMYAKCESLNEAQKVFDNLPNQKVVSWNAIVGGYTQHGQSLHALKLFDRMQQQGIMPDKMSFLWALKACGSIEASGQGKLIHDQIIRSGLVIDVIVGSTLVDMYCKCGCVDRAHQVFEELPNRNLVCWNAMITGYVQQEYGFSAFELFRKMQLEGVKPDQVTFSCLLKACSIVGAIEEGKLIHEQITRNGFQVDVILGCTLVDMYATCGKLVEARRVFDGLTDRNVVSWAAMIAGYAQQGQGASALDLFEKMQQDGLTADKVTFLCILKACNSMGTIEQGKWIHGQILKSGLESDLIIGNTIIDMYAKCGNLEEARVVFDKLPKRDVVSWSAMITGYAQHGDGFVALELFEKMQEAGKQPEMTTFLCLLKACGSIGAIEQGKVIHKHIIKSGFISDTTIGNTLIDMYCKCSSLKDACKVFEELPNRDVVSWNVMIAGYAQHRKYSLVRLCLDDMQQQGLKPDCRTYTNILAACSHAGHVDEGLWFFKHMCEDHSITPTTEHFNCIIDILGRSGQLKNAEELLQTIPVLPDTTGWVSLLTACRTHGEMELGRHCFDQIAQLDPNFATGYMLMSNIYAESCMVADVDKLQQLRKCIGAWKKPGMAWIEVHSDVHEFTVGDKTHPQSENIYMRLITLDKKMKKKGYVPNLDVVLEPMLDDNVCPGNLAVAFGFLTSAKGASIRFAKTHPPCETCCNASNIMSRIDRQQVIIKDAYHVHDFLCLCVTCLYVGVFTSAVCRKVMYKHKSGISRCY